MAGLIRFYGRKLSTTIKRWERQRRLQRRFPTAAIAGDVQVRSPHLLHLGQDVQIQKGVILHCGGMAWSNGAGRIDIGAGAVISPYCVLYGAGEIIIGERFDCGPHCLIFSSRSAYRAGETGHVLQPVTIGRDVILFAGCIVSPGVTIGDGAVVGAGSVVLDDLPAWGVYAGSPARQIGQREAI